MALAPRFQFSRVKLECCEALRLHNDAGWRSCVERFRGKAWAISLQDKHWRTLDGYRTLATPESSLEWTYRFGNCWIVLSPDAAIGFEDTLKRTEVFTTSPYEALENGGAVIVESDGEPLLSGGSFCETRLEQAGSGLFVSKTIRLDQGVYAPDTVLKLRREAEYLEQLPENAQYLFASYLGRNDGSEAFTYRTSFAPAYTVAERLFHGSLTGERALSVLEAAYGGLAEYLYGRPHSSQEGAHQEPDVLSRVKRRFDLMLRSEDSILIGWPELIRAEFLEINGRRYHGWPTLEAWIKAAGVYRSTLAVYPCELCHGDFIFDDMVLPLSTNEPILVDPNYDSQSRLYDVSKSLLSAMSYYEVLKYGAFSCRCSGDIIELEIPRSWTTDALDKVAQGFPECLRRAGVWTSRCPEPSAAFLFLMNGLQNIALPMFHLIHHRNRERSLAFFALGIIRMNQSLAMFGLEDPLTDVHVHRHSLSVCLA